MTGDGAGIAGRTERIRNRGPKRGDDDMTAGEDGVTWHRVLDLRRTTGTSLLAAHRQVRGWTLEEAARRLGALRGAEPGQAREITPQMLCSWERGRRSEEH